MFHPEVRQLPLEKCIKMKAEKSSSSTVVDYVPGNGTRYIMVFTDLTTLMAYGDVSNLVGVQRGVACMSVSWINSPRNPSMLVTPGFLHYSRIREKLGTTTVDGVVIGELIAHLVEGITVVSTEEYLRSLSERPPTRR